MLPKNSVYFDPFNTYLKNIVSAGLFDKWFSATANIFYMENRAYQIDHSEARQLTVLGVDHLGVAFLCLIAGQMVGVAAFFVERRIV